MVPGVIVKAETGIVRRVVSTEPAALVGTVALTETVHAAPVPRASVMVHAAEVPVDVSVPIAFKVSPDIVGDAVVTLSEPPEMANSTVSAEAGRVAAPNRRAVLMKPLAT